jgi:hypothetical protein
VAGDLERYDGDMTVGELEEFRDLPEEVRRAALEYARGLQIDRPEPEPLPDEGDVKFILVGVQQHGRAILFASSQVTETRFARQVDGVDRVPITADPKGPCARVPRLTAIVGAKMAGFEQYIGDDYRDALRTMLTEWERKKAAAERRQRELPGGGWL